MPQRRRDDMGAGITTAVGLAIFVGGIALAAKGVNELLKYRPRLYKPPAPDRPTEAVRNRGLLGGKIVIFVGVVLLAGDFLLFIRLNELNEFARSELSNFLVGMLILGAVYIAMGLFSILVPPAAKTHPSSEEIAEQRRKQRIYTVYVPKNKADYITTSQLMQPLLSLAPRLTLRVIADESGIYWQVIDPLGQYESATITSRLQDLPGAAISQVQPETLKTQPMPMLRQYFLGYLQNEYVVPLPFLESLKGHDPLTSLTRRLGGLQKGERIYYWVMALVGSPAAQQRGIERIRAGYIAPRVDLRQSAEIRPNLDTDFITQKLSDTLYHCFVGITIETQSEARSVELAHVGKDVGLFEVKGQNGLRLVELSKPFWVANEAEVNATDLEGLLSTWKNGKQSIWLPFLLPLCPQEIAALWHTPNDTFTAERIIWGIKDAPTELINTREERVIVGTTATPGKQVPVGITIADRPYHHYIIGKTGTGKSTLQLNLIMQDIVAGRGVAVIDPHGKLVEDILACLDRRYDEVSVFDCGNSQVPVPLNPFRIPPGVSFAAVRAANEWALRKMFEDIAKYPRMEMVLGYVLDALLSDPEATPMDISRLFNNQNYRDSLIARMEDNPEVSQSAVNYWREFEERRKTLQSEIADPILNRTGIFLRNRTLEAITCHPGAINVLDLVKRNQVVLVNLSGDAIMHEVDSLAALFLAQFYMASKSLSELSDRVQPRYYVYVDELERVVTSAFSDLLSQVRKFGLSLTLAHQFLKQLPTETHEGILGNVGTMSVFEVGATDARELASYFEPEVSQDQLVSLGTYRAAVKTRYLGNSQPSFIVNTQPPPPPAPVSCAQYMREQTIIRHRMLSKEEVRERLKQRYAASPEQRRLETATSRLVGEVGEGEPPATLPLASVTATETSPMAAEQLTSQQSEEPELKKTPPPKPRRTSKLSDFDEDEPIAP